MYSLLISFWTAQPFDAIPVPFIAMTCSSNFPMPIDITDDERPLLTRLSKFALDNYNAENQVLNYLTAVIYMFIR